MTMIDETLYEVRASRRRRRRAGGSLWRSRLGGGTPRRRDEHFARQVDQARVLVTLGDAVARLLVALHLVDDHILEAVQRLLKSVREAAALVRWRHGALLHLFANGSVLEIDLRAATPQQTERR